MYLFILSPSQPCPSFVKTGPLLPVGIVQNLYLPVLFQVNDVDLVSTSSESRLFVCEYSDCSAVSKFLYRCHFDAFYLYIYGAGCGSSSVGTYTCDTEYLRLFT